MYVSEILSIAECVGIGAYCRRSVISYRMRSGYEIRAKAPKHQTNIMSFYQTNLLKNKNKKSQSKVDTLLRPALSRSLGDMVVRMSEVMPPYGCQMRRR